MIYYLSGVFDDGARGQLERHGLRAWPSSARCCSSSRWSCTSSGTRSSRGATGSASSSIELWFFGGLAKLTRDPTTPGVDFRIAAAGPAVTLSILVACCGALAALGVTDLGDAR